MDDPRLVLADAHVHIYDCYDPATFLDAAHENFRAQAERLGNAKTFLGLLLLSEASGCDWFRRLREEARRREPRAPFRGWRLRSTEEANSLLASTDDGRALVLVAGHQIATAERLEVLALGCEERPREGLSLPESIEHTTDLGGVPVVAWGAGKWLGGRGNALLRLLEAADRVRAFFLGDNAGRLGGWPLPAAFRIASRLGIGILPGSDPLPFKSHVSRAGSFGFSTVAPLSAARPSLDLKRLLARPDFVPRPYGRLARPLAFARDQLAMQVRARSRWR